MKLILASGSVVFLPDIIPARDDGSFDDDELLLTADQLDFSGEVFKALGLGADTVVVLDGEAMGKPADEDDAFLTLRRLSGRAHSVYTSVALISGDQEEIFYEKTDVYFYELSDEEIREYIATGEPMDKAGSYGIQGRGRLLIRKIDGDYFTVVGLPVARVARALKKYNVFSL